MKNKQEDFLKPLSNYVEDFTKEITMKEAEAIEQMIKDNVPKWLCSLKSSLLMRLFGWVLVKQDYTNDGLLTTLTHHNKPIEHVAMFPKTGLVTLGSKIYSRKNK